MLEKKENLTPENIHLANIMGWCVEMVSVLLSTIIPLSEVDTACDHILSSCFTSLGLHFTTVRLPDVSPWVNNLRNGEGHH